MVVGALLGYWLWPAHRTLGALDGAAFLQSAVGLIAGDVTWRHAIERVGMNARATATSLNSPKHPGWGGVGGAFAGGLLSAGVEAVGGPQRETMVGDETSEAA